MLKVLDGKTAWRPQICTRHATSRVSTQIDLRQPDEIREQGRGPLESSGANCVHLPVIPEGGSTTLDELVGDTG